MKNMLFIALALSTAASLAGCKKKEDAGKKADPSTKPTDKPTDKPADPPPPPPAAADKELDVSAWGAEFAGWVVMAPDGTKVVFDDPSRQLTLPGDSGDYVSVGEAPGWDDAVKGLATDKDNSEITMVSPTEARWMRNPPLGKQWNFDVKVDVGGKPYSCSGNTFTDAATADKLVATCKSLKKK